MYFVSQYDEHGVTMALCYRTALVCVDLGGSMWYVCDVCVFKSGLL